MKKVHAVVERSADAPTRDPYSQAVRLGELIFVAGQAGLDPATGVVVGTTFEPAGTPGIRESSGRPRGRRGGLQHVVKTTCFLAAPEAFDRLNELYAEYFPNSSPARSTPVVQLPRGLLFFDRGGRIRTRRHVAMRRGKCG